MPQGLPTRWPDHWYHDQDHIHCIVPNCGFVVPNPILMHQWGELLDHCMHTAGTEHRILTKMLKQGLCAIDDCDHSSFNTGSTAGTGTRGLFAHEIAAHGSTKMSDICSFVTLAREGRVCGGISGAHRDPNEEIEKLAFQRMLDKVAAMPSRTIELLFQKHELLHPSVYPPATFSGHLVWILTADVLEQPGDRPPYWWPVCAEHFLWLGRPIPNKAADDEWRPIWNSLRDDYAQGRI